MTIALNAVRNASVDPVTAEDIVGVLRSGRGVPSHVRAVFGDVQLLVLERLAFACGIDFDALVSSYRTARVCAAAANEELEALLGGDSQR